MLRPQYLQGVGVERHEHGRAVNPGGHVPHHAYDGPMSYVYTVIIADRKNGVFEVLLEVEIVKNLHIHRPLDTGSFSL